MKKKFFFEKELLKLEFGHLFLLIFPENFESLIENLLKI